MPTHLPQAAVPPGQGTVIGRTSAFATNTFETFDSGSGDGGSEVVSRYQDKLYVTNGEEDRIDIFDIASGDLVRSIDLTTVTGYDGVNSVTVGAAGIAVAVERDPEFFSKGIVAVFDLEDADAPHHEIKVGNLPDMVTYSKDGTQIFVANEGEAHDGGDPRGSISIIDVDTMTAQTFGFGRFDSQVEDLRDAGVRIFPGKLPSTDFEPEYIAEGDNGKLYVTLQEANAVAIFDLDKMGFTRIKSLGTVDHSQPGFGIDPSDKDDAINIHTVPVFGMRMPDAVATAEIRGKTYFVTANEGDARDEDVRVEDLVLDPTAFPDAAALQEREELGRLQVSSIDGDTDGDGDYDALYSYGSRSFTVYDNLGQVLYDSGDDFETMIAQMRPRNAFNNDDFPSDDPDEIDENRSDNKGPEPEAIAVGEVDGRTLVFIGLERDSGIMVYDITRPRDPKPVTYIDSFELGGHISPEVITFIPASESESGIAQIAVSYEVSGTTALFDIEFGKDIIGSSQFDSIEGSTAGDIIRGLGDDDLLFGLGGDDQMLGGLGNDLVSGGIGSDQMRGGRGEDTMVGGTGNDQMNGGLDADTFVFELGDGNDTIFKFEAIDTIDMTLSGLEFADLTITQESEKVFLVEYGDQGDTISVQLKGNHSVLDENDFLF